MSLELDPIRARLEKAGFHNLLVRTARHRWLVDDDGVFVVKLAKLDDCRPEQADMLAWAPSDIAALLDEVDTLREWVQDVGQAVVLARLDIQTGGGVGMSPGDQFDGFAEAVSSTVDRMVSAEAVVARIRKLHVRRSIDSPFDDSIHVCCAVCERTYGWPCPTVKALGDEG